MEKTLYCLQAEETTGTPKFAVVENEEEAEQAWHFFFDEKGCKSGKVTLLDEVDGHRIRLSAVEENSLFAVILITTMMETKNDLAVSWLIGSTEVVAWYPTWQEADDLLTHRADSCSKAQFAYALIEEVKHGLHPAVSQHWLYEVKNPITVVDDIECANPDRIFVPMELPSNFIRYSLAFSKNEICKEFKVEKNVPW